VLPGELIKPASRQLSTFHLSPAGALESHLPWQLHIPVGRRDEAGGELKAGWLSIEAASFLWPLQYQNLRGCTDGQCRTAGL